MKTLLLILASISLFGPGPALAIDPGVAQGSVHLDVRTIKLTHAYAYNDRVKEMRIVLADRELPQSALPTIPFLLVAQLARESKVRGLLVQVDPNNRKRVLVTVLDPEILSRTAALVHKLELADNRVVGELQSPERNSANVNYRVTFSAPLFARPR